MHKPNCNCTGEIINKIKEQNNLNVFIYFRDQDIFSLSLLNAVIIEEKIPTKAGKERTKTSHVNVRHRYCPFCGKEYLAEERPVA